MPLVPYGRNRDFDSAQPSVSTVFLSGTFMHGLCADDYAAIRVQYLTCDVGRVLRG